MVRRNFRIWGGLLALALLIVGGSVHAGGSGDAIADGFVTGTEDLPLMDGLTMAPDATVFDAPQGRIVEAFAVGDLTAAAVRDFYQTTLPQLGWQAVGNGFRREGESLVLDIQEADGGVTVRFSLSPAGG